jgi:hypothetical protein
MCIGASEYKWEGLYMGILGLPMAGLCISYEKRIELADVGGN